MKKHSIKEINTNLQIVTDKSMQLKKTKLDMEYSAEFHIPVSVWQTVIYVLCQ